MLIKNYMDEGLVNGSRGVVVGYRRYDDQAFKCWDEYSYGMRMDRVKYGLIGDTSDETSDYYENKGNGSICPIVSFRNGKTKVVTAARFDSRIPGIGTCWRDMIPLKVAFAMTVHKSQGMTLDYVVADMEGVFANAQVYVALSRAKDENGLEIRNYDARKVKADVRALQFYQNPNKCLGLWNANDKTEKVLIPRGEPNCLAGKAFVLTGDLPGLSRPETEQLIKNHGGLVRTGVSGKTNFLVAGEFLDDLRPVETSKKYKDATKIVEGPNKSNLQILNRDGLFNLIQTSKPPQAQAPGSIKSFFSTRT